MLTSHMPDLVVLDLGLPDMDGEEFIRVARRSSMIPIIVLSARSDEQDIISALDLGANDYITKPFGTGELLARVRASLRINRMNLQAAVPASVFTLGDLEIDYDRRQVTVGGRVVHVTQTEFNILLLAIITQSPNKHKPSVRHPHVWKRDQEGKGQKQRRI